MITYITGDVTQPLEEKGIKFIAHCCNNVGGWGRGVVLSISNRWGMPELIYRKLAQEKPIELQNSLGEIQVIPVEKDIMVINIIGQDGIGSKNGVPPIRYDAIKKGLDKAQAFIDDYSGKNPTLHLPRIGAGLAGGDWEKIEKIIKQTIKIPTFVYTLPSEVHKYKV